MDKPLPKLSVLSILYKPPETNPPHVSIHSEWIRARLLSVNLVASETRMEALYLLGRISPMTLLSKKISNCFLAVFFLISFSFFVQSSRQIHREDVQAN